MAGIGFKFFCLTVVLGFAKCILDRTVFESKQWDKDTVTDFLYALITAVTVIVIAIPEGLPLAVTISFAFSVMKMKRENNWVRKLASSETMGGADQICTDKTGTLTKNQMTVREFYTMEQVFKDRPNNYKSLHTANLLAEGVLYNCSARIELDDKGNQVPAGNVTEQGLIRFLMDLNVPCQKILAGKPDQILHLIPFNSSRKRAATCIRHPENPRLIRAFCKGAPEIVLQYVNKMFDRNGQVVFIDENKKEEIKRKIVAETFAVKAYRTLLIAYSDYTEEEYQRLKA
jgi:magnesium-transporting ATPase (P-type)